MKKNIQIITSIIMATILWSCQSLKKTNKMKQEFNNIVVFGDGLSDMGKWGKLTNYQYPPANKGFYESRWTNGKVWVELVAEKLNLSLSLENNFAMGGATTSAYNINEPLRSALQLNADVKLEGMLSQVHTYLSRNPKIDKNTLITIWAGGHDIGNYLDYGQPDLEKYPPANNYKMAIELLVKAGAKKILIGTMPDMGFTPVYFGTPHQEKASKLCRDLNNGLEKIIKSYENSDVKIYKLDGAKIFAEVGMNPQQYGFKYTEAYLPFEVIDFSNPLKETAISNPNQEKGLNPDEFMNWWAVSASAKMHQIISEEAMKIIQK